MSSRKNRRHKKKVENLLPQYYVKILKKSNTEVTREATEEMWDGDDLQHYHTFNGIERGSEMNWDFILNEPIEENATYYLIYVLHSAGDSFHSESGCLCMVQFVKDYEDAVAIRNAINNDLKVEGYSIKLTLPKSGKEIQICTSSWKGYFEHLESINIETLTLK